MPPTLNQVKYLNKSVVPGRKSMQQPYPGNLCSTSVDFQIDFFFPQEKLEISHF